MMMRRLMMMLLWRRGEDVQEDLSSDLGAAGVESLAAAGGGAEEGAALEPEEPEPSLISGAVKATFTMSSLWLTTIFSAAVRAAFWSASLSNSTKPNPLDLWFRFFTTWALVTFRSLNRLKRPSSSKANGRLATNRVVGDGVRLAKSRCRLLKRPLGRLSLGGPPALGPLSCPPT